MNIPSKLRLNLALLVLSSLFHLAPGQTSSNDFHLSFRQDDQSTRFSISGMRLLSAKLLNASPDNKIILKITHPAASRFSESAGKIQFPALSAITRIKITPIDDRNDLLIVRLAEKLPFSQAEFSTGNDINIADGPYHKPLERNYRMGIYYQKKRDFERALNLYRRVVFKNRQHRYAYFKAGQIRLAWKQFRLAEINFRHARENGCDSTGLYRDLASLYRLEGNVRLANSYRDRFNRLRRKPRRAAGQDSAANAKPIRIQVVSNHRPDRPGRSEFPLNAQKTQVSSQKTQDAVTKMPKKIVLYLIGIALAGAFLMVTLLRNLLRKQPLPSNSTEAEPDIRIPVSAKKQRLMRLARTALDPPADGRQRLDEPPLAERQHPVLLADLPIRLPEDSESSNSRNPAPPGENAAPPREMARELNLGLGEVELALNLTSEQRRHHQERDIRRRIRALHLQNQTIPQIARTLNLGQNEVELILRFTEQEQSVE